MTRSVRQPWRLPAPTYHGARRRATVCYQQNTHSSPSKQISNRAYHYTPREKNNFIFYFLENKTKVIRESATSSRQHLSDSKNNLAFAYSSSRIWVATKYRKGKENGDVEAWRGAWGAWWHRRGWGALDAEAAARGPAASQRLNVCPPLLA